MGYTLEATCVSCGDSQLSTAASIAGILTFAYAIMAGIWFYLASGAEALATSPEQFNLVIQEVANLLETILKLNIDKATDSSDQAELVSKARRYRVEALPALKDLAKWMGGGNLWKYLDEISEDAMFRPELITNQEIRNVYKLFEELATNQVQRQWKFYSSSGKKYYLIPISPNWLKWAFRYRWNQKPLRKALGYFKDIAAAMKEINLESDRIQERKRQEDNFRKVFAKLDSIVEEQQRLKEAMGIATNVYAAQEEAENGEDPILSLMRPPRFLTSQSTLSLARDVPLPDSDSGVSGEEEVKAAAPVTGTMQHNNNFAA